MLKQSKFQLLSCNQDCPSRRSLRLTGLKTHYWRFVHLLQDPTGLGCNTSRARLPVCCVRASLIRFYLHHIILTVQNSFAYATFYCFNYKPPSNIKLRQINPDSGKYLKRGQYVLRTCSTFINAYTTTVFPTFCRPCYRKCLCNHHMMFFKFHHCRIQ